MKVMMDVCVIPIGVGVSLSGYVAVCEEIFEAHGLEVALHANGTNIVGEWDVVFGALKECHQRLHDMGAPRISTTMRAGTRVDREQTMAEKVASVEAKMKKKA